MSDIVELFQQVPLLHFDNSLFPLKINPELYSQLCKTLRILDSVNTVLGDVWFKEVKDIDDLLEELLYQLHTY